MAAEGALKAPFRMLMGTGEILCLDPVSFHFIQFNEGAVSFLVEPGDMGPVEGPLTGCWQYALVNKVASLNFSSFFPKACTAEIIPHERMR